MEPVRHCAGVSGESGAAHSPDLFLEVVRFSCSGFTPRPLTGPASSHDCFSSAVAGME